MTHPNDLVQYLNVWATSLDDINVITLVHRGRRSRGADCDCEGVVLRRGDESTRRAGIGSASVCLATFAVAMVLMYAVKATGTLRVSREGEMEGLDLHEHGMVAYPEYVIHGYEPGPTTMSAGHAHASMAAQPSPLKAR